MRLPDYQLTPPSYWEPSETRKELALATLADYLLPVGASEELADVVVAAIEWYSDWANKAESTKRAAPLKTRQLIDAIERALKQAMA